MVIQRPRRGLDGAIAELPHRLVERIWAGWMPDPVLRGQQRSTNVSSWHPQMPTIQLATMTWPIRDRLIQPGLRIFLHSWIGVTTTDAHLECCADVGERVVVDHSGLAAAMPEKIGQE